MTAACVLAGLVGFILVTTRAEAAKCNCQCPYNYAPVCAADPRGVEGTYSNQCSLECYKCTHGKDLRILKQGECSAKPPSKRPQNPQRSKCNCNCQLNYAPICAIDTKGVQETYPNLCSFECYICTHGKDSQILKKGECSERNPKSSATLCNCNCVLTYSPVCAVDPKGVEETYHNKCTLECYKCTHAKDLRIKKREECSNKGNSRPSRPTGNINVQKPPAPKCNCQCPFNNDPVCAVDSKGVEETYPNQCTFECYKCTHEKDLRIKKRGECPDKGNRRPSRPTGNINVQKPPAPKCNCQCPFNNDPVCAVDSKGVEETYPNQCAFECYKCTHEKDLRIKKRGECSNKESSQPSRPTADINGQKPPPAKCKCECPFNYAPLCAADLKGVEETYPNQCAFECYKCTHEKDLWIKKRGECSNKNISQPSRPTGVINGQKPPPAKCKCECPFNYAPLCAADSKGVEETFPNRCSFECYKCTHEKDYTIRKQGECSGGAPGRPGPRTTDPSSAPAAPRGKCFCGCPRNYAPVCAVGRSNQEEDFSNQCIFECHMCTKEEVYVVWRQGECVDKNSGRQTIDSRSLSTCNCRCTSDYSPLCAVNSRGSQQTFPNRCGLDCSNCVKKEDFVFRREGECQQTTFSTLPARTKTRTA